MLWEGNVERFSQGERLNVMVIDDDDASRSRLSQALAQHGHAVSERASLKPFKAAMLEGIDLILAEQQIGGVWFFDAHEKLRMVAPASSFVIVTAYPSVANAVKAIRTGCQGYIAKPATVKAVLAAIGRSTAGCSHTEGDDLGTETPEWPSLDRSIWEYLNQVYVSAGSMSEAARRLRVDRRSLRRMLAKHPPRR
jgi:two-component system, response regulator RegA